MRDRILNFGLTRFPKCTESGQVIKVKGEIKEWYQEKPYTEGWYMELADVYISATHCFMRFGNVLCKCLVDQIEERPDFMTVYEFVERKMEINEARQWKGNRHVKKVIKRINYKTGAIIEEVIK